MARELSYEDFLFVDFRDSNNENSLIELIGHVNPWLYAIVISFIFDENKTEDILDNCWKQFVNKKYFFKIKDTSIIYEIYLLVKIQIKSIIYDKEV